MQVKNLLAYPFNKFQRFWIVRKFYNGYYPLEYIRACLCGELKFQRIVDEDRYGIPVGINLCKKCGIGLQNPRPTQAALECFYKKDYRRLYRGSIKIDHTYFMRSYRRGERIYEFIKKEKHIPTLEKQLVVEIGCGPGGILKVFQDNGHPVLGCELDEACVAYCNQQEVHTFLGGIETLLAMGAKADLVILSHLLEHLPDPVFTLKLIRELLSKKGYLYIEVPGLRNPDSNFFHEIQVAHLWYFDLNTLQYTLSKAGFKLITGNEDIGSVFSNLSTTFTVPEDNYQRNLNVVKNWEQ
jgi:SAM-dependent methyltransferase